MLEIILSIVYLIFTLVQYNILKKLNCNPYVYLLNGIFNGIIIVVLTMLIV